jgi:hypothetical protein
LTFSAQLLDRCIQLSIYCLSRFDYAVGKSRQPLPDLSLKLARSLWSEACPGIATGWADPGRVSSLWPSRLRQRRE